MEINKKIKIASFALSFTTVTLTSFALNTVIWNSYSNRIRHVKSLEFLIKDYHHENQKFPASMKDLGPQAEILAKPFEGNLEMIVTADWVLLQ
jgi:hypothetical protein